MKQFLVVSRLPNGDYQQGRYIVDEPVTAGAVLKKFYDNDRRVDGALVSFYAEVDGEDYFYIKTEGRKGCEHFNAWCERREEEINGPCWRARYVAHGLKAPTSSSSKPRRAPDHAPFWYDMPADKRGLRVSPEDAMAAVRALSGDSKV